LGRTEIDIRRIINVLMYYFDRHKKIFSLPVKLISNIKVNLPEV